MSTLGEHVREFAGLPVRSYDPEEGIVEPAKFAQRVGRSFDYGDAIGEVAFQAQLDQFLADPQVGRVVSLVIGPWWDDSEDVELKSDGVVAKLVSGRDRLTSLRAIFLGDIVSEEQEITWIKQSDVTPLLEAFPAMEQLRVRGSGSLYGEREEPCLVFRPLEHAALRSLIFEAGCLPAAVSQAVAACRLPKLEHLELWLGDSWSSDCSYSGDTTVADLAPIFSGESFPALKSLALRNTRLSDEIAAALAEAPILRRLDTLDLSLGTLGNSGVLALLQGGALSSLKRLDIHHHYVSDEVLDGLKALSIELDASDQREADDDDEDDAGDRYIAYGE